MPIGNMVGLARVATACFGVAMVRWTAVVLAIAMGCGGSRTEHTTPDPEPHGGGEGEGEGETRPPEPDAHTDFRSLPASAAFRDVVAAARRLDDRRDQESTVGCLLRSHPARLEADLAVAVRPLAPAADDLDERLGAACEPVRLLTRWGVLGGAALPSALGVVAFTTTPPVSGAPAAVLVTGTGIHVRLATGCLGHDPEATEDLANPAVQAALRGASVIALTAEAATPLARVIEVLGQLDALGRPIALAVVLEPETRLPENATGPANADPNAGLCPQGLPPLDPQATEGNLDPQALMAALASFREGAQRCLAAATGPGAAGGRITVAFRIGPDGHVQHACSPDDRAADPALRACVLESLRATPLPTPSPPGTVDVQLPIVLTPDAALAQHAVCR